MMYSLTSEKWTNECMYVQSHEYAKCSHPHPYTPSIIDMRLAFLTMAASSEWVFGASSLSAQALLPLPPPSPPVVSTSSPCVVLSTKYLDVGLQRIYMAGGNDSQLSPKPVCKNLYILLGDCHHPLSRSTTSRTASCSFPRRNLSCSCARSLRTQSRTCSSRKRPCWSRAFRQSPGRSSSRC